MAELIVTITEPLPDSIVDRLFEVKGTVEAIADTDPQEVIRLSRVDVRLGNGPAHRANGLRNWTFPATVPSDTPGGTVLEIRATAFGQVRVPGGDWVSIPPASDSVGVRIERIGPVLAFVPEPPLTIPVTALPLTLTGTARDPGAGVQSVMWKIGDGAFAPAENITGDWSEWRAIIEPPVGTHSITVRAADTFGNTSNLPWTIHVQEAFQPSSADLALAPITYLQDLMGFAGRWIAIGTGGAGPTAQDLAQQLFQPFDRLAEPDVYEAATRSLHQTRIAVEVLRRQLARINESVPPKVEREFRRAVYEAVLLQFGTSDEELRAARIANDVTRRALAERLGFGLETTRPDRLDRITLMPDRVTVAQLEQLFGFERTTHANPLRPVGLAAEVLDWRLAAVRDRWAAEDSHDRDGAAGPLPIVDPDLVSQANLHTTAPGDHVYDLWRARKTWLEEKLADVERAQPQGFDFIVRTFIGALDIPALAAQDEEGLDIRAALDSLNLELDAFRYLAKCRQLASAGGLLDTEWHDVFDIVIQVQKKRRFLRWRREESGLLLAPEHFRLPDRQDPSGRSGPIASSWRVTWRAYAAWHKTLAVRITQLKDVRDGYQLALDGAEIHALPILRDSLIAILGEQPTPHEDVSVAADRLSRELAIDFRANASQKTTRVAQAIDALLSALFSVRAGRLATGSPLANWTIPAEPEFDQEWRWMASYTTWHAAMMVFAYPENQLFPHLFVKESALPAPTEAYLDLIGALRETVRMTPAVARERAGQYLTDLRAESGVALPPELEDPFVITDEVDSIERKTLVETLFLDANVTAPHSEPNYLREVFWLVPMAIALALEKAGHYLTALDWYQTVYAFNLAPANRKIYRGLYLEESIDSLYARADDWLVEELNPHFFGMSRKNASTRFAVLSIVGCFLEYADAEFSRHTPESVGRARTLYQTAEDLLDLPDAAAESGLTVPFLPNPIWESLRLQSRAGLAKIRNSMNIAGFAAATAIGPPTQYRYAALADRAKQLVAIAQQVESAYLGALERRDAAAYDLLQAGHDLQVARAQVSLQDLKITDADLNVRMAELQRDKARIHAAYFEQQLEQGLSDLENAALAAMRRAIKLQKTAGKISFLSGLLGALSPDNLDIFGGPMSNMAQAVSAYASAASMSGSLYQTMASFERREQDWQHEASLSLKDVLIGEQGILIAQNQRMIALMERQVAGLQVDHAAAVVEFLVNKFTNAELYEWMSGVLGRVYNYFLQQATAVAQLAQSQLSFERQEPALAVIQSDYWQTVMEGSTDDAGPDRRGLTGSARLLEDFHKLDQYAFATKQRKLQLTQTLSLAQLAPLELQNLRETGQLIFATPMRLFDQDFPGHYLRLIWRVWVSVVALVPPTRGLRATLAASGLSRVVTGGETFKTVNLRRSPEAVSFTSPINATGLFQLEPEADILFPFEGMGVDTTWELEIPKPANPFDYDGIADVLLTIEYTALFSAVYREQVIRQLNGTISGERMFSLREQFVDAWYELTNSDALATSFATLRGDFPPHIGDLQIRHVTLRLLRQDGFAEEIGVDELEFTAEAESDPVGGAARTVAGIISTRRPNGAAWLSLQGKYPVGLWKLQLSTADQVREWLKDGLIEDVGLAVTYEGVAPQWPA